MEYCPRQSRTVSQNNMNITFSDKNTDPTHWKWDKQSRADWQLADATLVNFRDKWYGNTDSGLLANESTSLELEPFVKPKDPQLSSLFVRPSYPKMFESVLMKAEAMCSKVDIHRHGIIITGQPGTGKTLFSFYLLVRLLQLKQVVLYSPDGKHLYLFYHDGVYKPIQPHGYHIPDTAGMDSDTLPHPISPTENNEDGFIWSLFDIVGKTEPEDVLVDYPCFPVQTASPPVRYNIWRKRLDPVITGLPLWSREELAQGLQYQRAYHGLFTALSEFYAGSSPNARNPLSTYPGIRALLEGSDDGDDTLPQSPEDAIEYLLDVAISRFGYSARDVFSAVFDFESMIKLHKEAISSKYFELQEVLSTISMGTSATDIMSDYLLTLSPIYPESPLADVRWEVDFKSDWIAKSVIRKLDEAESDDSHSLAN